MEDKRILKKQLEYVYQQMLTSPTFSFLTVLGLSVFLYFLRESNLLNIVIWVAASLIITLIRYAISHIAKKHLLIDSLEGVKKSLLFSSFLGGLIWAICGYVFIPVSTPVEVALITTSIIAVVCSTVPILSPYYFCFVVFAMVSILPAIYSLLATGNIPLGILAFIPLTFVCVYALKLKTLVTQSISIDFKNKVLLDKVSVEKERAEKAKEKADLANQSKSAFLAAASHDLRQPLHSMGIFLDILSLKTTDMEQKNIVSHINNSHQALTSLFNSLLEVSRVDSGNMEYNIVDCQLLDIINPIIIEFDHDITHKHLSLETSLTPQIIKTDPILLGRIVRNLLSNAIKFTDSGRIVITNYQHDGKLYLSIKDTGIGIDEEQKDHIFNEYYQINNKARDRSKGVGLGLSVVKKLSDLLGHNINLISDVGCGSEFILSFKEGDANAITPREVLITESTTNEALSGLNIMVIDNEPSVIKAMQTLLQEWHANTLAALSLNDAIQKIKATGFIPEVIICDYRLEDNINGIDVINALRKYYKKEVPAFLISGDTDQELRTSITQQGYFILQKPTKAGQLKRTILLLLTDSKVS